MTNDSIGRIANAHLAHTDLYGFKTEVCLLATYSVQ